MKHELKKGQPVTLTIDVSGLKAGTEGLINSMVNVDDIDYAYFMPVGDVKMFVVRVTSLKFDARLKDADDMSLMARHITKEKLAELQAQLS